GDRDIPMGLAGPGRGTLRARTARDAAARPSAAALRDRLGPAPGTPATTAPVVAVAAPYADGGTATIPNAPAPTEVGPVTTQAATPARRRRRWPWLLGWLVGAMLLGAAAAAYLSSDSGTSKPRPATTVSIPATTPPQPPPPPTTLPPAPSPEINRGPGNDNGGGNDDKGGRDVQEQFKKWLDDLQKRFRDLQNGG